VVVYRLALVALCSCCLWNLACSSSESHDGGLIRLDGQSAGDTSSSASRFTLHNLAECGQAGYHTVASASADKVVFASLASTAGTAPCALLDRTATAPVWDICVVLPTATGYAGSIPTSQPYVDKPPTGVGIALDKAGEPVLAYTGGPSGSYRCGASDMLIAGVSGGKLGTPRTLATGSESTGMPADQAAECIQNVCGLGDATGFWPSIALDPVSGTLGVAFRDMHFGRDTTDYASSDVEFARGDGYAVYTVDVSRGGGSYNRVAFSPAGKAAVVHYAAEGRTQPAVWLDRETDQGWQSLQLAGSIREEIGFGISAQGLWALAYFDASTKLLMYRESSDGATWSVAENIDNDGLTGYYPSLAFDDQGSPAVAYYRCADNGAKSDTCDPTQDGLFLARRRSGIWKTQVVRGDPDIYDGLYAALAFVAGKAVIAFQSMYFDPLTDSSKVALNIAEEQ
jgi:hypothetical protein